MSQNRHLDVYVMNMGENAKIIQSQLSYSFSMNIGSFKTAKYEDENILILVFDNGEIRIELLLEEIKEKLIHSDKDQMR